jgi:hypothetical protein
VYQGARVRSGGSSGQALAAKGGTRGNKTRMLEFRTANALKAGADCMINAAVVQSND